MRSKRRKKAGIETIKYEGAVTCPICKSTEIYRTVIDGGSLGTYRMVFCNACKAHTCHGYPATYAVALWERGEIETCQEKK